MKQIDGVPESITRADYLALIESVGLDVKDLRSLEFRMDGIYAEVRARGADGKLVIDVGRDEMATHRIYIPVKD
jgi:hypothetical protein